MVEPSKRLRWLVRGIALILAVFLLVTDLPRLAGRLADASFGNFLPPANPEPPAIAWAPAWSTAESGALVGRGEGLDCSIPPAALAAFASKVGTSEAKLEPVNLRFRQACVTHDLCYRHGAATYGYTQAQCDAGLVEASFRLCKFNFAKTASVQECATEARKVLAGVTLGGTTSYRPIFGPAGKAGSGDSFTRASTIAEYDPYPSGAADFALPRLAIGKCGGIEGMPLLVTILRNAGGYHVKRRCFDGSTFGDPLPRADLAGGGKRADAVGSEYAYVPSLPWLTPDGGLTRRCRSYGNDTTGGDFARYDDPAAYAGCLGRGRETDPDVVTMFPVPGNLARRIEAVGIGKGKLRHVDADRLLPKDDRLAKIACMTGARGGQCELPLPKACEAAETSDFHRWFASPPAIRAIRPDQAGSAVVAVTLFARGCGNGRDYQALRSRTALLDGAGWLPNPGGKAFRPAVHWAVPESAEPVFAHQSTRGPRLVGLHVVQRQGLHWKRPVANLLLLVGILAFPAAVLLLLLLSRRAIIWGLALAGFAAACFGLNGVLGRSVGDGFTDDAEFAVYSPGGATPSVRRLLGGRAWLQQRLPIVPDEGRTLVLMSRFERPQGKCGGTDLCLDMWIAAVNDDGSTDAWHALRAGLPPWAVDQAPSKLMLVPFREKDGALDLLLMGVDGSQLVFRAAPAGANNHFQFVPLGSHPRRGQRRAS